MKNQLIALLIALVILFLLGLRNMDPVTLDYLAGDISIPLAYLLAGFLLVGMALVWAVATIGRLRSGLRTSRLKKEIERRDQEIARLKEEIARHEATAGTAAEAQATAGREQEGSDDIRGAGQQAYGEEEGAGGGSEGGRSL